MWTLTAILCGAHANSINYQRDHLLHPGYTAIIVFWHKCTHLVLSNKLIVRNWPDYMATYTFAMYTPSTAKQTDQQKQSQFDDHLYMMVYTHTHTRSSLYDGVHTHTHMRPSLYDGVHTHTHAELLQKLTTGNCPHYVAANTTGCTEQYMRHHAVAHTLIALLSKPPLKTVQIMWLLIP